MCDINVFQLHSQLSKELWDIHQTLNVLSQLLHLKRACHAENCT